MPPENRSYYSQVPDLMGRGPMPPGAPLPPGYRPDAPNVPPELRAPGSDLVTQTSLLRPREVARPNDYTGANGAYENPYTNLQKAHEMVRSYGIQFAAQEYYSAIGNADRVMISGGAARLQRDMQDTEARLRQNPNDQYLLQRRDALKEIWLSPATTRANFAMACIRSGNDQYVRLGENMLREAITIRREIAEDPNFQRHYRDAYTELARKRGVAPVIPPIPRPAERPPDRPPNPGPGGDNPNPTPRPEARPIDLAQVQRILREAERTTGAEPKWILKEKGENGQEVTIRDGRFYRKNDNAPVAPENVRAILQIPNGTEAEKLATESRLRNRLALVLSGAAVYEQFLANHRATKVEGDNRLTGDQSKLVYKTKNGAELEIVGVKDGTLILKERDGVFKELRRIEDGGSIILRVAPGKLQDATKNDLLGQMICRLIFENKTNVPQGAAITPLEQTNPTNPPTGGNPTDTPSPPGGRQTSWQRDVGFFLGGGAAGVALEQAAREWLRRREIGRIVDAATRSVAPGEAKIVFREKAEAGVEGAELEIRNGEFVRKSDGQRVASENVRAILQVPPGSPEEMRANEMKLRNQAAQTLQLREVGQNAAGEVRLRVGNQAVVNGTTLTVVGGNDASVLVSNGQVTEGTNRVTVDAAARAGYKDIFIDGMEGRFVHSADGKVYKVAQEGAAREIQTLVEMNNVRVLQEAEQPTFRDTVRQAVPPARPVTPADVAAREVGPPAGEGKVRLRVGLEGQVGARRLRVIGGDNDSVVVRSGEMRVGTSNGTVYNATDAAYQAVNITEGAQPGDKFVKNAAGEVFKVVEINGRAELAPVSGVEAHGNNSPLVADLQRVARPPEAVPVPGTGTPGTGGNAAREVGPDTGGSRLRVGTKVNVGGNDVVVIGGNNDRVVVRNGTMVETGTNLTVQNSDMAATYHEVTLYNEAGQAEAGKFVVNAEGKVFKVTPDGATGSKLTQMSGVEAHTTGSRSPAWSALLTEAARLRAAGPTGETTARPEGAAFSPTESAAEIATLRERFAGEIQIQNGVMTRGGQTIDLVAQAGQEIESKKRVIEELKRAAEQATIDLNDAANKDLKALLEEKFGPVGNDQAVIKQRIAQLQAEAQLSLTALETAHAKATDANAATRDVRPLEALVKERLVQDRIAEEMSRRGVGREAGMRARLGRFSAAVFVFSGLLALSISRTSQNNQPTLPPIYAPTVPGGR